MRIKHKDNGLALGAYGHAGARHMSWYGYRWIGAGFRSFGVGFRSTFFGIRWIEIKHVSRGHCVSTHINSVIWDINYGQMLRYDVFCLYLL